MTKKDCVTSANLILCTTRHCNQRQFTVQYCTVCHNNAINHQWQVAVTSIRPPTELRWWTSANSTCDTHRMHTTLYWLLADMTVHSWNCYPTHTHRTLRLSSSPYNYQKLTAVRIQVVRVPTHPTFRSWDTFTRKVIKNKIEKDTVIFWSDIINTEIRHRYILRVVGLFSGNNSRWLGSPLRPRLCVMSSTLYCKVITTHALSNFSNYSATRDIAAVSRHSSVSGQQVSTAERSWKFTACS